MPQNQPDQQQEAVWDIPDRNETTSEQASTGDTAQSDPATSDTRTDPQQPVLLGEISDAWRSALVGSAGATVVLVVWIAALGVLTLFNPTVVFYALFGLTGLYIILRLVAVIAMYRDSKTVNTFSQKPDVPIQNQWTPRYYFWTAVTFIAPPMCELIPVLTYLYYRRANAGVP